MLMKTEIYFYFWENPEFITNKTINISDHEKYIFPFYSNETIPVVIENLKIKIKINANLIACS